MPPGRRVQILFTPKSYGTIPVKSLYQDQGFAKYVETTFMNIKVQGLPMIPKPLPTKLVPHEDLRQAHVDNVRTLVFSEGGTDDNPTFLLNGKTVDMDRVDQLITLGTTEEWHLINKSFEMHPFHIHINPFQVISINGKPVDMHGYVDTMGIPAHGEVVMRTRYLDFDGKFVLHCHILFHEDHGMMQVVEIVKPGAQQEKDNGEPGREMTQKDMMANMQMADMGVMNRRAKSLVTTYTGTLPCADCSGIKTTLTLTQLNSYTDEGTYTLSSEYTGKNMAPVVTSGKWITRDEDVAGTSATVIIVDPDKPNAAQYYLQVSDKTLEPLDKNMQKISSPFDMNLTAQ
jgi:hypothetical protein